MAYAPSFPSLPSWGLTQPLGNIFSFCLVKLGQPFPCEQGGNCGASGQAEVCGWRLDLFPAMSLIASLSDLPHPCHLPTRPFPDLLWPGQLSSCGVLQTVEGMWDVIQRSADATILERWADWGQQGEETHPGSHRHSTKPRACKTRVTGF